MREWELKAVVGDLYALRQKVMGAGAQLTFLGRLEDRRYDMPDRSLEEKGNVLRLRVYRTQSYASASLDWKGPTEVVDGFKVRDELTTSVGDPVTLARMLENVGYSVVQEIDREIAQYDFNGTIIRFEVYPQMDNLVEVEGDPEGINEAIALLEMDRQEFTADALPEFMSRFEDRTGLKAAVSDKEFRKLAGSQKGD